MLKVRLETTDGDHVTDAVMPPFETLPSVVMWGVRVFKLYDKGCPGVLPRYRETFAVAVFTEAQLTEMR